MPTDSLKKLVTQLNDLQYHAGTDLAKHLQITRSAVWKLVKQLQKYGIQISSVKAKGYCLQHKLNLLDSKQIKKQLSTTTNIEKIVVLNNVDSTNNYLKNKISQQKKPLYICLAEQQTAGKARLGRTWFSPFGVNIYLSLSWKINKDTSELGGLSLIIGAAVVQALAKLGIVENIGIKWPNDIYWQDQKLVGILIEIIAETNSHARIIIGVGLNVNMTQHKKTPISKGWTSLEHISQTHHDRNKVAATLIQAINDKLQAIEANQLSKCLQEWEPYDLLRGKHITITQPERELCGIAQGINQHGQLLLKTAAGAIVPCSSGETSISKF